MPDSPGQPESRPEMNGHATQAAQDERQTVLLTTAQAAAALRVNPRTVRRYIDEGVQTPSGVIKLVAREIHSPRGRQFQIVQADLDAFQAARDRAATEGQPAGELKRTEEAQSQAVALSYQIISAELERRNQALVQAQETIAQAQATIERLAREAGRSEGLERELEEIRQRVAELEKQRDYWQAKARKSYRIQLFPFED